MGFFFNKFLGTQFFLYDLVRGFILYKGQDYGFSAENKGQIRDSTSQKSGKIKGQD